MINPDIVNYIKGELQKGIDRQIISSSLLANGWNNQDITEAFASVGAIPTTVSVPSSQTMSSERPAGVKRFEFLMYLALLIGLASSFVGFSSLLLSYGLLLLTPLLFLIIPLALVLLTARGRKDWARWVLAVIVGVGAARTLIRLFFGLTFFTSGAGSMGLSMLGLSLLQIIVEIIAFRYIFSTESNNWFSSGGNFNLIGAISNSGSNPGMSGVNRFWTKIIPRTNIGFLVVYLIFVFGIDMFIALSQSSLLGFWYIMLAVFAVFVVFFVLENFVFRKIFMNTQVRVDGYISTLVVLRNILVLLNVIPFIQLIGMLIGVYVMAVYIPLYIVFIIIRFSQTKKLKSTPSI